MYRLLLISLFISLSLPAALSAQGWISLFNGKDLGGWRASETKDTWIVTEGAIKAQGKGRSHLFYAGAVGGAIFKNFELRVDVKTEPESNGGIYFHTEYQDTGFPERGFEVQVNNTYKDKRKTGSLYGVQDVLEAPAKDGKWFKQSILVQGNQVTIKIDGKTVTTWTQPADWQGLNKRGPGLVYFPDRKLTSGTFALQGHDQHSVVYYKNIKVRMLP